MRFQAFTMTPIQELLFFFVLRGDPADVQLEHGQGGRTIRLEPKKGGEASVEITGCEKPGRYNVAMQVRVPYLDADATVRFSYDHSGNDGTWRNDPFALPYSSDGLHGKTEMVVE